MPPPPPKHPTLVCRLFRAEDNRKKKPVYLPLNYLRASLVAQLVKNPLQCRRPQFNSWFGKILWRRDRLPTPVFLGFPCGSAGKESACNAGDPSLIPGSGRSAGEGIGYPLQYSWASLVVQLVKNLSAMRETWVLSLGWVPFPGEGKGYPLQYSGLENSMDSTVHGVAKSQTQLRNFHLLTQMSLQGLPRWHKW